MSCYDSISDDALRVPERTKGILAKMALNAVKNENLVLYPQSAVDQAAHNKTWGLQCKLKLSWGVFDCAVAEGTHI